MLYLVSYLLGVFTAYLETQGHSFGGFLAALSACGIVVLRIVVGDLLHPYTSKFWESVRERAVRPGGYLEHHFEDHPTHKHKECHTCKLRRSGAITRS